MYQRHYFKQNGYWQCVLSQDGKPKILLKAKKIERLVKDADRLEDKIKTQNGTEVQK